MEVDRILRKYSLQGLALFPLELMNFGPFRLRSRVESKCSLTKHSVSIETFLQIATVNIFIV